MPTPTLRGTPTKFEPTAAVTTVTNSVPTGVVDTDELGWLVCGSTTTAPTTPSGWTLETSVTTVANGLWFYKRRAASEPASYNMTVTSARYSAIMAAWSDVDTTTPIDVASPTGVVGTTAIACPAITPVTPGALILGLAGSVVASGVTTSVITSSNTTIQSTATSKAGAAANNVSGVGSQPWSGSGSFTPLMATSTTTTRTMGLTVALRPAPVPRNIRTSNPATPRSYTW